MPTWSASSTCGARSSTTSWAYWPFETLVLKQLLRSAEVAKMPASYERLANLQRDMTPERAASQLRELL